jgi:hypothetical protein
MASLSEDMHGYVTCVVDVSPDIVDAGAEMTLRGMLSCSPPCDLRGHVLLIKDEIGADAGSMELTEFDGETNTPNELVLKAPLTPGKFTWSVVCPAVEKGGTSFTETSTQIVFTVTPHATYVVAWDVPSDIVARERFTIKVGIKCSNECRLAHSDFAIYDHEGTRVAVATLPDKHWPGTAGLYVSEVELVAPASAGLYTWSVKRLHSGPRIPHSESSISFGVRVVDPPEHLVTIETVDGVSRAPLRGAHVVMHPYRAVADEHGVARIRAAKGGYRLFVSETNYLTFGLPIEVASDMTVRAELDLEPVLERN